MAESTPPRGRRPGRPDTRAEIARAAGAQFAAQGFERTSIRSVARAAGVDPSLVLHHFGSKQRLFVETTTVPFDTRGTAAALAQGDRATIGARFAAFLLGAMERDDVRAVLLGRIRAAASQPDAAELLRDTITGELVGPLVRALGSDQPELRAGLVSAQLMGFAIARWIVGIEAVVALSTAEAAAVLGPALQRLLAGPLHDR